MEKDILNGLENTPKSLPSKYFYDASGDALFQAIMDMPEYYLSRSEMDVFLHSARDIIETFAPKNFFEIIELGAGDGSKTKVLIRKWLEMGLDFSYVPIDISKNVLNQLASDFRETFDNIQMTPIVGDYFNVLKDRKASNHPKLVLFLGSNIGNLRGENQARFIQSLSDSLNPGDGLFIGFDLVKNPHTILEAYNDKNGITKQFNINLLARCNRELNTNFDLNNFTHYPIYDPKSKEARSYLVSTRKQVITFPKSQRQITLEPGETIHTETSRKYTKDDIEELMEKAGLKPLGWFYDCKHYFVNALSIKQ